MWPPPPDSAPPPKLSIPGWFNLLGQVAVTAGIDFTMASFLATIIQLGTGGANSELQLQLPRLPGALRFLSDARAARHCRQ
jgi:hypothetical protein